MASNGKKSATQLNQEIDEVLQGSRPGIPSQAEYERREFAGVHKRLEEIQRAPLADRKEAQASFLKAMRNAPELGGERLGWLLDGNYGRGSMMLARRVLASPRMNGNYGMGSMMLARRVLASPRIARRVLASPRMNRPALLTQMIGALEWQSPEVMSREAWKKLTAGEKARLDLAVQEVIANALSEE